MIYSIREATTANAEQLITYVQRASEEPNANITLSAGEFNLTARHCSIPIRGQCFIDRLYQELRVGSNDRFTID